MLNEAISIREVSLYRDPQNARSRSLLAGNYAERGSAFLSAGKSDDALRDIRKAVELQTTIIELDPKGTAARISMADYQSRLGTANTLLARESAGPRAQQYWREAAKYFRRADALFAAMSGEGLLLSAQIKQEARMAAEGAAEAARHVSEN